MNAKDYEEYEGLFFHKETPLGVRKALFNAYVTQNRVRLFYGEIDTGKSWLEEHDVLGYVSRSTGEIKVPILVHNSSSTGGTAILDRHIVRVVYTKGGFALYSHPTFYVPDLFVVGATVRFKDNDIQSTHKTTEQAARYVAFLKGERFTK